LMRTSECHLSCATRMEAVNIEKTKAMIFILEKLIGSTIIAFSKVLFLIWRNGWQYKEHILTLNPNMDEMQQSVAQEGKEPYRQICPNCHHELSGRYCSSCGQDSRPFQRSLGSILSGAAEGFFDLDGKILKSIVPILTSPGKLTLAYLEGKRRAQVNPFQLYAFFSFLFFFTSLYAPSFFEEKNDSANEKSMEIVSADSLPLKELSVELFNEDLRISPGNQKENLRRLAEYDSSQNIIPEEKRDGRLRRFLKRRSYQLSARLAEEQKTVFSDMKDNFKSNLPNTLIFLLPLFAMLLKLFYLRRDFFFVDHLIFSIHQFCFLFLIGTFYAFAKPLVTDSFLPWILSGLGLYFIVAMKRVYAQSWRKTMLKLFLISMIYSIVLALALSMNFLYAVLFQL
jgi:hypothetical protein